MFIYIKNQDKRCLLTSIDENNSLYLNPDSNKISFLGNRKPIDVLSSQEPAELYARFTDIVEALTSDTVKVYYCTKPVGYWKDKGPEATETPKKPGRKKATPKPAEPKTE